MLLLRDNDKKQISYLSGNLFFYFRGWNYGWIILVGTIYEMHIEFKKVETISEMYMEVVQDDWNRCPKRKPLNSFG